MTEQVFSKQFLQVLPTIYQKKAAFVNAFGQITAVDGVRDNATAFTLKSNDLPVTIGAYNTGSNVAFGTGTANSSRFGAMQEVIYADTTVPYNAPWAIHEGLDRYTVNADLQAAVTDRMVKHAQALIQRSNVAYGAALVAAGTALTANGTDVQALFNEADDKVTQLELATENVTAYVSSAVYNKIIDSSLATTGKSSAVNVDANSILEFKGFKIVKVPDAYLGGKQAIFAPDNVGRVFVGISTMRTIDAIDFDGVELQGAGKDGIYIPSENNKAIFFVNTPAAG